MKQGNLDVSEKHFSVYAKLSGFLFLWLIATGLIGAITISRIVGIGTFDQKAFRVAASEGLYRISLISELIGSLSTLLLAYCLYVLLKPVNSFLARTAMYFRIIETCIGCVSIILGFVILSVYTISNTNMEQQANAFKLLKVARVSTYNIGGITFGFGSTFFYYLFFKTSILPKILSALGIAASIIVIITCLDALIFPQYLGLLQYGWAPMAVAEISTGLWLVIKKINVQPG